MKIIAFHSHCIQLSLWKMLASGILLLFCFALSACHESLSDRAARESKEYTEKFCPTPVINDERTDSMSFDKTTHTMNYYRTLSGKADNPQVIKFNAKKLRSVLLKALVDDPGSQAYKNAGFNFHFQYRSAKHKGKTLFEVIYTPKNYQTSLKSAKKL